MFHFCLYHTLSFVLTLDCKYCRMDTFFSVFPPLQTLPFYPWLWAKVTEVIDTESCELLHATHTKSETHSGKLYFPISFSYLSLTYLYRFYFSLFFFCFHLEVLLFLSLPPLLPCPCFFICLKPVLIYATITFTNLLCCLPASLSLPLRFPIFFWRFNSCICINGNKLKFFLNLTQTLIFRNK